MGVHEVVMVMLMVMWYTIWYKHICIGRLVLKVYVRASLGKRKRVAISLTWISILWCTSVHRDGSTLGPRGNAKLHSYVFGTGHRHAHMFVKGIRGDDLQPDRDA